jgi:hypothetical protein
MSLRQALTGQSNTLVVLEHARIPILFLPSDFFFLLATTVFSRGVCRSGLRSSGKSAGVIREEVQAGIQMKKNRACSHLESNSFSDRPDCFSAGAGFRFARREIEIRMIKALAGNADPRLMPALLRRIRNTFCRPCGYDPFDTPPLPCPFYGLYLIVETRANFRENGPSQYPPAHRPSRPPGLKPGASLIRGFADGREHDDPTFLMI